MFSIPYFIGFGESCLEGDGDGMGVGEGEIGLHCRRKEMRNEEKGT